MKTRNQIIEFIKEESNYGKAIVYATIGNGGSGLTVSSYDFTEDLEDMDFDGIIRPADVCEDIQCWVDYDENSNSVYQFSDENGLKYQIVI